MSNLALESIIWCVKSGELEQNRLWVTDVATSSILPVWRHLTNCTVYEICRTFPLPCSPLGQNKCLLTAIATNELAFLCTRPRIFPSQCTAVEMTHWIFAGRGFHETRNWKTQNAGNIFKKSSRFYQVNTLQSLTLFIVKSTCNLNIIWLKMVSHRNVNDWVSGFSRNTKKHICDLNKWLTRSPLEVFSPLCGETCGRHLDKYFEIDKLVKSAAASVAVSSRRSSCHCWSMLSEVILLEKHGNIILKTFFLWLKEIFRKKVIKKSPVFPKGNNVFIWFS